jgi:hypothetical protein
MSAAGIGDFQNNRFPLHQRSIEGQPKPADRDIENCAGYDFLPVRTAAVNPQRILSGDARSVSAIWHFHVTRIVLAPADYGGC